MPTFFITINSDDVYNPVVKFLAGLDIDVDCLLPDQVPNYWEQALLVAQNPAIAAKIFNIYMKAFLRAFIGYDAEGKNLQGGIFGIPQGYYGCVEAQGRGSLHCHMLIWLKGSLNPDEIKHRVVEDQSFKICLLNFMEDSISTCVPDNPNPSLLVPSSTYHPCSVRGVNRGCATQPSVIEYQKDFTF